MNQRIKEAATKGRTVASITGRSFSPQFGPLVDLNGDLLFSNRMISSLRAEGYEVDVPHISPPDEGGAYEATIRISWNRKVVPFNV